MDSLECGRVAADPAVPRAAGDRSRHALRRPGVYCLLPSGRKYLRRCGCSATYKPPRCKLPAMNQPISEKPGARAFTVAHSSQSPVKLLDRLLVSRLVVTAGQLIVRRWPFQLQESIPKEPRLMLVREGLVHFRVDAFKVRLSAGDMIFMPAWVSRDWKVARSPGKAATAWCRFSSVEADLVDLSRPIVHKVADLALETAAFQRISGLMVQAISPSAGLEAEAELKAILGRFLAHASPVESPDKGHASGGEQGIEQAVEFFRKHYADPQALNKAPGVSGLSPKYFRGLFKKYTGLTPSSYLLQSRMRAARYLQHESPMRVKEVAAAVGYEDPFYFSRLYRRFWGHAPTEDRRPL